MEKVVGVEDGVLVDFLAVVLVEVDDGVVDGVEVAFVLWVDVLVDDDVECVKDQGCQMLNCLV